MGDQPVHLFVCFKKIFLLCLEMTALICFCWIKWPHKINSVGINLIRHFKKMLQSAIVASKFWEYTKTNLLHLKKNIYSCSLSVHINLYTILLLFSEILGTNHPSIRTDTSSLHYILCLLSHTCLSPTPSSNYDKNNLPRLWIRKVILEFHPSLMVSYDKKDILSDYPQKHEQPP